MLIVTGGVFKKQGSERLLYSTEVIAPFVLLFFAPKYSLQILSGSREGFSQRGGGAWRPSKRVVSLPLSFRGYDAIADTDKTGLDDFEEQLQYLPGSLQGEQRLITRSTSLEGDFNINEIQF